MTLRHFERGSRCFFRVGRAGNRPPAVLLPSRIMSPMRVVLSYTHSDSAIAAKVRDALTHAGFEVWDPELQARGGDNFALEIGRALERADALVVLVSPEAMQSDWIRWEIEHALGNPRFEGRLIPVELRPTEELPWILRRFQVLKYEGGTRPIVDALIGIRDAA